MCHPDEIFEVFPDGERIRPCTSRADVISRLSANLLAVLPNTRCVLVEDEDDAAFYRVATAIIAQSGSISLQPLPIFQPACAGSGRTKESGGKTVVANWVEKLNANRITLTAPAINHAANVLFLVTGASKSKALLRVLRGVRDPQKLPAQLIQPSEGSLLWFVDEAAAGEL